MYLTSDNIALQCLSGGIGEISRIVRVRRWVTLAAFMLVSLGANAQQFGNWTVQTWETGDVSAVNRNSSDSTLGYLCEKAANQCFFFFMPDRGNCRDGARYSYLVNAGNSSGGRITLCRALAWDPKHQTLGVFENTATLQKQMMEAGERAVGIARGVDNRGGIVVSKFEMSGFEAAFNAVNQLRITSVNRAGGGDKRF